MKSLWRRVFGDRSSRAARPLTATVVAPPARVAAALPPAPERATTGPKPDIPAIPLDAVEDRFHRFVLGMPPAAADQDACTPVELATLKRLGALTERFDVRSLPRLPVVLPQLLRELKNDKVSGGQLAVLIARDPVLVGEVMRVTGSAHYRTAQPIRSVQQAVVLLGQEGLRRVATQHVMKPILQASAGMHGHMAGPALWEHAERCAHACAYLGRTNGCEPFEAYLAGMVCHSGIGAIVRLLDQEAPPSLETFSTGFLCACMQLGARLSLRAALYWELPAGVVRALSEQADAPAVASRSPLGKALLCADLLAAVQLLAAHHLLPGELDCSEAWPECFKAPVLLRCQQDLQRQFQERTKA